MISIQRIEAVIHPQQRIHSCVDSSTARCLPKYRIPTCFSHPICPHLPRTEDRDCCPLMTFMKNGTLTFFLRTRKNFDVSISHRGDESGQSYPCFLNAANEVLVDRFLKQKISWLEIGTKLEKLISSHHPQNLLTLEAILEVDVGP